MPCHVGNVLSFKLLVYEIYYDPINLMTTLQEIMVYLIGQVNQKLVILTFGQFDHIIILDKSIWTCLTWLVIFFTNHKMVFLTNQIKQKFGQSNKFNFLNSSNYKYENINNKWIINTYLPTMASYLLSTTHLGIIHLHTCTRYIYEYTYST